MKFIAIVLLSFISINAFAQNADNKDGIQWMSWTEAYEANKKDPKKIFIDIYTDWCGWCIKMDKTTFKNSDVVKALGDDFYAVKLNAEMKDDIEFNGATFSWTAQGRKGTHQLAYALLDVRMGYPAFVMLDESFNRIMLSPGYKEPKELITELNFSSTEAYKTVNFNVYKKQGE